MTGKLSFVVMTLALALASGCKKQEAAAASNPTLVAGLEALATKGCACKDKACGDAVYGEVQKLAASAGRIADTDLAPLQAAQSQLDQCLAALNPRVSSYTALTEAVCACADKSCAKKVSTKFSAWASDLKSSGDKLSPGDGQAIMASGKRASECLSKHGLPIPQ